MSSRKSKQTPVAMLVIYDRGFKFKYCKYYLKIGVNFIGSHESNHIVIDESNAAFKQAAKLIITSDLATIEPLHAGTVYVPSNMRKKNLLVEIEPGTKYVVEMEKDFSICGRKAIMQISPVEELMQVRGVVNQSLFEIKREVQSQPVHSSSQRNNDYGRASQFEPTLLIEQENYEATLPIEEQYGHFEATQVIEEEDGNNYEPTLPLEPLYAVENVRVSSFHDTEQLASLPSSRNANSYKTVQIQNSPQISMAETIQQNEMPQTIQQDMAATIQQSLFNMPPTVQQQQNICRITNIKSKLASAMTKSVPISMQNKIKTKSTQYSKHEHKSGRAQGRYYSYQQQQEQGMNNLGKGKKDIENFQDLFGGVEDIKIDSNKKKSLKSNSSRNAGNEDSDHNKTQKIQSDQQLEELSLKNKKSSKGVFSGQSIQSKNKLGALNSRINGSIIQQSQEGKEESQETNKLKKIGKAIKNCVIIGQPKTTKLDLEKLNMAGYQIVEEGSMEEKSLDYQLLLIGSELTLSKTLMKCLIEGKQVRSYGWINNPQAKIVGKLEGFPWESIEKRKGRKNEIFASDATYYLQPELREDYEEVMLRAGAKLVDTLSKSRAKQEICIICDEKTMPGRNLYEQKKNYKNWSFFSKKMIIESILMGEEISEKYRLDSYSF